MKYLSFWTTWVICIGVFVGCGNDKNDKKQDIDLPSDGGMPNDTISDAGNLPGDGGIPDDAGDTSDNQNQSYEPPPLGDAPWFFCSNKEIPEGATVITAFNKVDQYHGGEPNRRKVDAIVDFPEKRDWQRIDMIVRLECPEDGICDAWDRMANIALVDDPGEESESNLELARYITPYGIGMCLHLDLSRFASRLRGQQTIRSFIDTWVHPDEPIHGHGWRISIEFLFHPGTSKNKLPSSLVNLWPTSDIKVGDPNNPISSQLNSTNVATPTSFTRAELIVTTTGHGQGNADNCAEFCPLDQFFIVNGIEFSYLPWRDDCEFNPAGPEQLGSWQYPRSGWCPGAYVNSEVLDITSALTTGTTAAIEYQVRMFKKETLYENTCRPGAGDSNEPEKCEGCVFDNESGNCDYNSGNHTAPVEKMSAQVVFY